MRMMHLITWSWCVTRDSRLLIENLAKAVGRIWILTSKVCPNVHSVGHLMTIFGFRLLCYDLIIYLNEKFPCCGKSLGYVQALIHFPFPNKNEIKLGQKLSTDTLGFYDESIFMARYATPYVVMVTCKCTAYCVNLISSLSALFTG